METGQNKVLFSARTISKHNSDRNIIIEQFSIDCGGVSFQHFIQWNIRPLVVEVSFVTDSQTFARMDENDK